MEDQATALLVRVEYAGRFDGFHSLPAFVSKTFLVRFDSNKYSLGARAVGWQRSVPMRTAS